MNTKDSPFTSEEQRLILDKYYCPQTGNNMQNEILSNIWRFVFTRKQELQFVKNVLKYEHDGVLYLFLYRVENLETVREVLKSQKLKNEIRKMIRNTGGIQSRLVELTSECTTEEKAELQKLFYSETLSNL